MKHEKDRTPDYAVLYLTVFATVLFGVVVFAIFGDLLAFLAGF